MQEINKPFKLEGAANIRELGGYTNQAGIAIQKKKIIRSDALYYMTEQDCEILHDYGIRHIIDLRSMDERTREPDRIVDAYSDIEYLHVPLQDHVRANRYSEEFPPSMWELYRWMMDDSKDSFGQIFHYMMDKEDGVLFHCSGGKDRTGMVAMMLLLLADIDEDTIVEDYAVTEEYMKEVFPKQLASLESRGLVVPPHVMQSPASNMVKTLSYMHEQYHTIEEYLKKTGMTLTDIDRLRNRMLKK